MTFDEMCLYLMDNPYSAIEWEIITNVPKWVDSQAKIHIILEELGIDNVKISDCIFIAEK